MRMTVRATPRCSRPGATDTACLFPFRLGYLFSGVSTDHLTLPCPLMSLADNVSMNTAGNGVVSYYLALVLETVGVTSVTDQTLISAFLNVWNLLFSVAAAFSVDRVGRRPLFLASAAIMLVGFILVTGLSGAFAVGGASATGIAVIPFLFVFFAGYDIAM
jgi:MFS family permease